LKVIQKSAIWTAFEEDAACYCLCRLLVLVSKFCSVLLSLLLAWKSPLRMGALLLLALLLVDDIVLAVVPP
jgi:hypothetical protein